MKIRQVTLGAGCFWCVEAVFLEMKGIQNVLSGYMGGYVENPNYKAVCTGTTGHAEVVKLEFDEQLVSLTDILAVFFKLHDPTSLNQQGADVGTQYRSAIFTQNEVDKQLALNIIEALNQSGAFSKAIVTTVAMESKFYPAEEYHRNYLLNNPEQAYCRFVVQPKVDKFRKVFSDFLK